jgi:hypothetical protein
MTIKLDLPEKLEHELAAEAARLGLPVEAYALRLLARETRAGDQAGSGAEVVEYWRREHLIGYRPDIQDSLAHARQIRHQAERRPRG